jgi:hypothetical protein
LRQAEVVIVTADVVRVTDDGAMVGSSRHASGCAERLSA